MKLISALKAIPSVSFQTVLVANYLSEWARSTNISVFYYLDNIEITPVEGLTLSRPEINKLKRPLAVVRNDFHGTIMASKQ